MVTDNQNTGKLALDRFNTAANECPAGAANFTAGFIGALSVSFEDHGKLDKTAWDRAIKISQDNAARMDENRRVSA